MIKNHLLLIFLFSFTITSWSQNFELDEIHHEKALSFSKKDADSFSYYAQKLQESKEPCRIFTGRLYEAKIFYENDNLDKCKLILENVLRDIKNHKTSENYKYSDKLVGKTYDECILIIKINIYRRYFYIHLNNDNYQEAYNYLLLRKNHIELLQDKNTYYYRNLISVMKSMANMKIEIYNPTEALIILEQLEKNIQNIQIDSNNIWYSNFLNEKLNLLIGIASAHEAIGTESSFQLAEKYYDKAYNLSLQINSTYKYYESSYYIKKGRLYLKMKRYDEAIRYANKANSFYDNDIDKLNVFYIKSRVFSFYKQPDSSIFYGKKYLLNNIDDTDFSNKVSMYSTLSKNYKNINNLEKAYEYSELALKEEVKLNNHRTKIRSKIFKDEKQQLEVSNIQLNKKRKTISYILITVSIVGSVLILILILRKRNQNKRFSSLLEKYNNITDTNNKVISITPTIQKKEYQLDTSLVNNILQELSKIEASGLFVDKEFNLVSLSKLLKTNTSYLSQIINEHKKMPFRQYLAELRIEYLLKKLGEESVLNNYTIEAIGQSIGYSNASAFTRAFKKYKGVSPSEYLKSIRKEQI